MKSFLYETMMWTLMLTGIGGIAGCVVGCRRQPPEATLPYEKTTEIIRVFYHTQNHWSVMFLQEKEVKVTDFRQESLQVFMDAPADKSMYYIEKKQPYQRATYEIHIHNPKEIGGGAYQADKSSTGQAHPIE